MLKAGDVVDGRYRLVDKIAEGGMGVVWRARHLELERDVALKVLLAEVAASTSGEQRFRREAQAAAKLQSPNVVRVLDFGVGDGRPYLAMELLDGEDCATRLAREGPLPLEALAQLLDGVAKAVDLAHTHGVVHRDLKPANLFLAREGDDVVPKVLDFGIAKVEGASSGKTTGAGMVGSPAYMSPEQVWAEPVGPATDVWSLGVVAFELATGTNPFDAPAMAKIFERIVRAEIPSARAARPELPEPLEGFFARALERDPTKRFASASALAGAFRRAALGGDAEVEAPREAVPALRGAAPSAPPRHADALRAVDPAARTVAVAATPLRRSRAGLALGAGVGLALLAAGARWVALGDSRAGASSPPAPSSAAGTAPTATGAAPSAPAAASAPSSAPADASAPAPAPARSGEPAARSHAPPIPAPSAVRPSPAVSAPAVERDPRFGVPRGQ